MIMSLDRFSSRLVEHLIDKAMNVQDSCFLSIWVMTITCAKSFTQLIVCSHEKSVLARRVSIGYSFSARFLSNDRFEAQGCTVGSSANLWETSYCGRVAGSRRNASSVSAIMAFGSAEGELGEIGIGSCTSSSDLGTSEVYLDFMCLHSFVLSAQICVLG